MASGRGSPVIPHILQTSNVDYSKSTFSKGESQSHRQVYNNRMFLTVPDPGLVYDRAVSTPSIRTAC
ncbi:MAG: hypothetical protein ACOC2T_00170, partial [Planctomycetota bacterium]